MSLPVATRPRVPRTRRLLPALLAFVAIVVLELVIAQLPAGAQEDDGGGDPAPVPAEPGDTAGDTVTIPTVPIPDRLTPDTPGVDEVDAIPEISVTLENQDGETTAQPLTIILLLTVVGLAPALLLLLTSFTRIIIVLGLTRNALSLQGIPPNQVLIGLSLFLTIFVMAPVLTEVNDTALQPLLDGEISQSEALDQGLEPFREFMLEQVRDEDLAMFADLAGDEPTTPDDIATSTLIPAFVLSELRAAFIIGFLVFVPFLVIDIVISATLMSMGMVMLPPVVISLPFKLLLFVVVDGWALLVPTLVESFAT